MTILKTYGGDLYLITLNTGTTITDGTVTITGATAISADVWFESRTETVTTGTITDTWDQYERHVYVLLDN